MATLSSRRVRKLASCGVQPNVGDVLDRQRFRCFDVLCVEDKQIAKLAPVVQAHIDALIAHARLGQSEEVIDPTAIELAAHC